MKQVAQNYKSGEIALLDVPRPACRPGGVLVRTEFSLISMGTEAMKIHESKLSLVGKARARPDQVKKVLETVTQQGPVATYKKVMNRLDSYTPLGYSLSGVVVEVGAGVDEFKVGQRVACGGNLHALHAEYNWVPTNLCVAIPDSVSSRDAAFATVTSISLQGFRQSEAKLGETACVIGLGLVGQLLVQILTAAGVAVVGIDVSEKRCKLAEDCGATACAVPGTPSYDTMRARLHALSGGFGADHIFLAAGGSSNEPVAMAAELARDRARVVDIGKCGLDLPWKDYYEKELDLRFSRSYGPGRYDPTYEEGGVDYPIGYVRWTERRNMACVLDLLAEGKLDLEKIASDVVPFDDAVSVYEQINSGELSGLGIVFRYPEQEETLAVPAAPKAPATGHLRLLQAPVDQIRLGVIGCGNYASTMLLPHLHGRSDVKLMEAVTATSLSAANAQSKFGFERVSTDIDSVLNAEDIDTVLIATRHDSHASLVCRALRAGKAVFVEKPLALNGAQLAEICDTVAETGNDRIMVGFNRRFAKMLNELKDGWGDCGTPQTVSFTVNAGPLDSGSWYAQSAHQGTRFAGEGGHFIDTVSWWLGSEPVEVSAAATPGDADNLIATYRYADGSVATIAYLTQGDARYPKEVLEVFAGGRVARLHNYQRTELWRRGKCRSKRSFGIDKGQKDELAAFVEAVKSGADMPVSLDSLVATTAATFATVRSVASQRPERIDDWRLTEDEPENLYGAGVEK